LGLPYIGSGARITPDLIDQAVRDYSMSSARPRRAGERFITIGADQGKLGTVVVAEWLPVRNAGKDISASFDCKVLAVHRFGDEEIWDRLGELMIEWQALYAVIDADPELNLARAFCKKFDGHAAVTRYRGVKATKEISETERETGAPMLTVDRTFWLSTALGRFKTKRIIIPKDTPDYFREHVCNMVHTYKRIKEDKRDTEETAVAVYVSLGEDHAAHALTYAEIALHRAPSFGSHSIGKIF
jgi:hypothetical protein